MTWNALKIGSQSWLPSQECAFQGARGVAQLNCPVKSGPGRWARSALAHSLTHSLADPLAEARPMCGSLWVSARQVRGSEPHQEPKTFR
jgi:hypothetical protein